VPFFIRTGKRLPVTQTELRLVFRHPPRLGFLPEGHRRPAPSQLIVKMDPATGIRIVLDARRADSPRPQEVDLDMEFAAEGGEGPTPYEVLLRAAIEGDSTHFMRQDSVEETWRIMQPLLDHPPDAQAYRQGSWAQRRPTASPRITARGAAHG
jgi:glucose-6-phosphate 1-dehydrogenase